MPEIALARVTRVVTELSHPTPLLSLWRAHPFILRSSQPRLAWGVGGPHQRGPQMRTSLLIVLAVTALGAGSALVAMNNACKSGHHPWCAPMSDIRHHTKTAHS
jgi:hypothetical protein